MHIQDSSAPSEEDTLAAQNALLEARAKYRLRNDAIEAVLMANPILRAVHNGTQASPVERYGISHCFLLSFFVTCSDAYSTSQPVIDK